MKKSILSLVLTLLFIAGLAAVIALSLALMPYYREIGNVGMRAVARLVAIVGGLIVAWIFKGWVSTTDTEFSISGFMIRIMGFAFLCWLLYMPISRCVDGIRSEGSVMVGARLDRVSPETNLTLFRLSPAESATLKPDERREVMVILREGKPRKTTSTSSKTTYYLMMQMNLFSNNNAILHPIELDSEGHAVNASFSEENAERLAQIITTVSERLKSVK